MSEPRNKDAVADGIAEHGEHDDFLARWSRRKTDARKGVELPDADEESSAGADTAGTATPVEHPAEPPDGTADATPELPPIESLDENSDYSAFLSSDVSVDVQRQALRKLFQSPKFNVRDGLDDYDLDFSNPEPLGDIITAEMRHRMRIELERLAGLDEDTETVAATPEEPGDNDDPPGEIDPEPDDEHTEPS